MSLPENKATAPQQLGDATTTTTDSRMPQPPPLPEVIHTYQNHLMDSTRWRHYAPRATDIVIATSPKSGTTWTQAIVAHLIWGTATIPSMDGLSPWLESRLRPLDEVLHQLETQQHRRFIKTHLPLDGLPFYPQVKYIVVGRDARDVFMSLYHHHTSFTDAAVALINEIPGRVGPPLPPPQQEIHAFWRNWITTGWFAWESEGYPLVGNLHHTKTWWPYRLRENILFVHFNDLLADLRGEIDRIARFLEIACSDQELADVTAAVTFATMKEHADQFVPGAGRRFQGGATTFLFKGTNGRWKDVLSAEELALYTAAVARVVTPECAAWLEHGRAALT